MSSDARALLRALREDGVRFCVRGGTLVVDAPVGVVGQQHRRELVEKKPEILSILTAETTAFAQHPEDIDPNDERTDPLVLSGGEQRAQLTRRLMEAIRHAPDKTETDDPFELLIVKGSNGRESRYLM